LSFRDLFKTKTKNLESVATNYLKGILNAELVNIQSVCESIDSFSYHKLHHFISNSPWSYRSVFSQVASEVSNHFNQNQDICLIIDESGVKKKGNSSVGVMNQYCGNLGKIDNCQVAVYGSLCQGEFSSIIDARLYLPNKWCEDEIRCNKAKIPVSHQVFKTKIELATEIINQQIETHIKFDYVLMDAFYGRDASFTQQIHDLGKYFIGDVRINQMVYFEKPSLVVKPKKGIRGKKPTKLIPDKQGIRLGEYLSGLKSYHFRKMTIRNTAKGKLRVKAHGIKVWIYDEANQKFYERTLVIRRNLNKNSASQVDYFLTNMSLEDFHLKQIIKKHATRYFIEHNFKEAKSGLGMHQFQTRKWIAWYHQTALIMIIQAYIMMQKIKTFDIFPILSANDVILLVRTIMRKNQSFQNAIRIFYSRYFSRQYDVNLHYI